MSNWKKCTGTVQADINGSIVTEESHVVSIDRRYDMSDIGLVGLEPYPVKHETIDVSDIGLVGL